MCLSSTCSEPKYSSLPLSVLSFFSTNVGGYIPLILLSHAGQCQVWRSGHHKCYKHSRFPWGETPTEKTCLIQVERVRKESIEGHQGKEKDSSLWQIKSLLADVLLWGFQFCPPNPAKLLSANLLACRWGCRTGLCFLLSIWWWLLVFGSCEIQMPSSRRIFPLLGTSGHPLSLTFSSHFSLESISFAYIFAVQIIQPICFCALIQG